MAARNKPPTRAPDVEDLFGLHLTAAQRREAMLEQVQHLRAAGRLRAAQRLMREAEEVRQRDGVRAPR